MHDTASWKHKNPAITDDSTVGYISVSVFVRVSTFVCHVGEGVCVLYGCVLVHVRVHVRACKIWDISQFFLIYPQEENVIDVWTLGGNQEKRDITY